MAPAKTNGYVGRIYVGRIDTGRLPKGEYRVLVAVAQHRTLTRPHLSILTGYTQQTRDLYLRKLIARRLLEKVERGMVRAAKELFS